MTDILESLGVRLRDRGLPITQPESRLLVQPGPAAVTVFTAEYERAPSSCTVVRDLAVTDASGTASPVTRVLPAQLYWANQAASLTFADARTLSLAVSPGGWRVRLGVDRPSLAADGGHCAPALPSAPYLSWRIEAEDFTQTTAICDGGECVVVEFGGRRAGRIVLTIGPRAESPSAAAPHDQLADEANRTWRAWFDRLPPLPEHVRGVGHLAWWTLAANVLRLHSQPSTPVVVPSKLGYVGHWNWDAYFIAIGLRRAAPELARAQLDLVLKHQRADGMFVDVIHDDGVLAATGDLPEDDHRRLAAHFGTCAEGIVPDGTAPDGTLVPVTKPPLFVWAANKLLRVHPDEDLRARTVQAGLRNQHWWLTHSDTDNDGLAEYGHPYSSGLDDNPVFDYGAPTATPDLNAYLALQYDELAVLSKSDPDRATQLRDRADAHTRRLVARQWDSSARRFLPIVRGKLTGPHTVTDLLPLVAARLPPPVADELVADLLDPKTFGADPAVPTVSRSDPAYQPARMWRGPVWLNTNYLLIEGLARRGRGSLARELANRTLQVVTESGDLAEYWDAESGRRPASAVPMFSWSAALFLDLAMRTDTSTGDLV